MPETIDPTSCFDEVRSEQWFNRLRDEVDYHCTFCEGLHLQISELEGKVRAAFASTARSLKGVYDQREIATRWLAMWSFAAELLATAKAAKDAHQLCGADLSGIEKYYAESFERFQFHCPLQVKCEE